MTKEEYIKLLKAEDYWQILYNYYTEFNQNKGLELSSQDFANLFQAWCSMKLSKSSDYVKNVMDYHKVKYNIITVIGKNNELLDIY